MLLGLLPVPPPDRILVVNKPAARHALLPPRVLQLQLLDLLLQQPEDLGRVQRAVLRQFLHFTTDPVDFQLTVVDGGHRSHQVLDLGLEGRLVQEQTLVALFHVDYHHFFAGEL